VSHIIIINNRGHTRVSPVIDNNNRGHIIMCGPGSLGCVPGYYYQ